MGNLQPMPLAVVAESFLSSKKNARMRKKPLYKEWLAINEKECRHNE